MTDAIEQKKKSLLQDIMKLREEYQVELPKRIAEARSHGDRLRGDHREDRPGVRQAGPAPGQVQRGP